MRKRIFSRQRNAASRDQLIAANGSLVLDFLSQVYKMNLQSKNYADLITFTRASGGGRINPLGAFEWVGANVPRIDHSPVNLAAGTGAQTIALAKDRSYAVSAVGGGTVAVVGAGINVSQMGASAGVIVTPPGSGTVDVTFTPAGTVTALHVREVLGQLVEEQRTNLWVNSAWPGVGYQYMPVTVTPNFGPTPINGVNSARVMRASDANGTTFNLLNSNGISASATPQSPSFFIKLNSANTSFSVYAGNGNSTQGQYFNFSALGGVVSGIDGAKIEKFGAGWHRLSLPFTPSSAISATANLTIGFPPGALDIELVGFQWESGSQSSSYIPTTGSQVTRAAETLSINPLSPFYNQNEGCLALDFSRIQASGYLNQSVAQPTSGSAYGLIYTNQGQIKSYDGVNSITTTISNNFTSLSDVTKAAVAWSSAGMQHSCNGVLGGSSAAWQNGTEWYNGAWKFADGSGCATLLKRVRYFPKRPSSSRLQSITT